MRRKTIFCSSLILSAALAFGCGEKKDVQTATDVVSEAASSNTVEAGAEVTNTEAVETVEEAVEETEPKVYFGKKSGFYGEAFDLELRCPIENAEIYYTLDGSTPTKESTKYEAPISLKDRTLEPNNLSARKDHCINCEYIPQDKVTKANVIRAIAYFEDGTESVVTNGTYFVGVNREEKYGDVPVISLITDEANLYDYETGIYVLGKTFDEWVAEDPNNANLADWQSKGNFSNKGADWERPVAFEYIGTQATGNYQSDLGVRIKGATTRGYYQKSLKLIARTALGNKNVKFPLIQGNMKSDGSEELKKYKSFVLRNGGNDNGFAKLRDPLLQSLISGRDMETQQSEACVVFINGEYFGLYAITEDYTDSYFEYNYGIDSDNIVVVKCGEIDEGYEEDFELFESTYQFITENDMSVSENYKEASKLLDMRSLCEYVAFEEYIYNQDSLAENNNWAMWRVRTNDNATEWSDGAWRMMLYDTEYSTGVYSEGKTYDTDTLTKIMEYDAKDHEDINYPLEMFLSLYENDEFKAEFVNSICDIRNYDFEKTYAVNKCNELASTYKLLAKDSILRNGPDWVALWQDPNEYYKKKISEVNLFLSGRYMQFIDITRKALGLSTQVDLSVASNDISLGSFQINNTAVDLNRVPKNTFAGQYFKEYPITLTALPVEGHEFVSWEIDGATVEDLNNPSITVTLTGKTVIKANFK